MPKLYFNTTNRVKGYNIEESQDLSVIYKNVDLSLDISQLNSISRGKDIDVVVSKVNELKGQLQTYKETIAELERIDNEVTSSLENYLGGESVADTGRIPELQTRVSELTQMIAYLRSLEGPVYDEDGYLLYYIDYSAEIAALQAQITEINQEISWLNQLYEIDNANSSKYIDIIFKIRKLHSEMVKYNDGGVSLPSSQDLMTKLLQKTVLIDTNAPKDVMEKQKETILNWADKVDNIRELAESKNSNDYRNAIYSLKGLQMEMLDSGLLPESLSSNSLLLMEKLLSASCIAYKHVYSEYDIVAGFNNAVAVTPTGEILVVESSEYNPAIVVDVSGKNIPVDIEDYYTPAIVAGGVPIAFYESDPDKIKYLASYINYMPYQDKDGNWVVYDKSNTEKSKSLDKWCAAGMTDATISSNIGSREREHIEKNYNNYYGFTVAWKDTFEDLESYCPQIANNGSYYRPEVGDTIFLKLPGGADNEVNHVGVVSGLSIRDGKTYVQTVEANRTKDNPQNPNSENGIWNTFEYDLESPEIVGYGTLADFQ